MLNECDTRYDVSAYNIVRAWQASFSNAPMTNINALSEMIDIINGLKICKIVYDDNN